MFTASFYYDYLPWSEPSDPPHLDEEMCSILWDPYISSPSHFFDHSLETPTSSSPTSRESETSFTGSEQSPEVRRPESEQKVEKEIKASQSGSDPQNSASQQTYCTTSKCTTELTGAGSPYILK